MATGDTDTQSPPPSGSELGSPITKEAIPPRREVLSGVFSRSRAVVRQQDFARHRSESEAPTLRTLATKGTRSWTWLGPFSKTVLLGVIRSSPGTLVWPLAVFILCTALGLFGIFAASYDAAHVERGIATEMATDAARRIELQIQQAFTPTIAVEIFIQQEHHFPTLMHSFPSISAQLLARVGPHSISNLQLAPNMVVQAVAPLAGNEGVIGMNLLTGDPERVADVLYTITSRNLTVAGPYKLVQGGFGVIIRQPVFVRNVSKDETFGANVSSQPCPECWDPASRTKLWGFAQGMARLDGLLQGSDNRLRALQKYGPWHISRLLPNGTEKTIASRSSSGSKDGACGDCVKVDILLPNAHWLLYLSKEGGWKPHWQEGLVALVVVGNFLLAMLLFCLLVAAQRHKALLKAMFPAKVLRPLRQGKNFSEEFDSVTILFSDIVSYTVISSALKPIEVAQMLNELYCEFDDLVDKNGCYKIETIGDAFMAVGGCPVAEPPEVAAERVAMMALDMVRRAEQFQSSAGHCLKIRVGLASGPVAAAVIGRKMPRYCLFGDTVNLASRMESTSESMRIQVAASTAQLLQRCAAPFTLVPRGPRNIKGKGYIDCFWLEAVASAEQQDLPQLSRLGDGCGGGNPSPAVNRALCSCGSPAIPFELRWTSRHLPTNDSGGSSLPSRQPTMSGKDGAGAGGAGRSSPQLPLSLPVVLAAAASTGDQACRDSGRTWNEVLAMRSSRMFSTGGTVRSSILRSLLRAGAAGTGQGAVGGVANSGASARASCLPAASRHDLNQPSHSTQSLSRYEMRRLALSSSAGPGAAGAQALRVMTAPIALDGASALVVPPTTPALATAAGAVTRELGLEGGAGPGASAAGAAAQSRVARTMELANDEFVSPDSPSTYRQWLGPSNLILTSEDLMSTT